MSGKRVVVLGNMAALGGALANRLAGLGHEAMALPGAPAPEVVIALRPEVLIVIAAETAISTAAMQDILRETGAAAVVVAEAGDPWAAWAEAGRHPMVRPPQAVEEIPSRLADLIAQSRAGERDRYLREVYGGPVLVGVSPRIIGFGGPKGGTGKSSMAANAAALLAARGVPVHVIDAESDTRGNMIDFFRVGEGDPVYSLVELAAAGPPPALTGGVLEPGAAAPAFWTPVRPPRGVRWDLRVTAGLLTVEQILGEQAGALMARAAQWLEFAARRAAAEGYTVILDAGNNLLSPLSMRAINIADILYIVLEPEDTGLISGASWLAAVYQRAGPEGFGRVRVIFNKVRGTERLDALIARLREHMEAILRRRLPRAIPAYMVPWVDLDIARAQTSLEMGVEYLMVLQHLTGGRYAAETEAFAAALQGILSEIFPALAQAPLRKPADGRRGRLRLPWQR